MRATASPQRRLTACEGPVLERGGEEAGARLVLAGVRWRLPGPAPGVCPAWRAGGSPGMPDERRDGRPVDVYPQETLAHVTALQAGTDGNGVGLRPGGVRCVLGAGGWSHAVLVFAAGALGQGPGGNDDRGTGVSEWGAAPGPAGGDGRSGIPVCVLRVGVHHGDGGDTEREPEPDAGGGEVGVVGQPLSVRGLRQDLDVGDAGSGAEPPYGVAGPRAGRKGKKAPVGRAGWVNEAGTHLEGGGARWLITG